MAFEGPEEPVKSFDACHYISAEHEFKQAHFEWQEAMSTARESALPVVNFEKVIGHTTSNGSVYIYGRLEELKPGETVALPGWGLEKQYQALVQFDDGKTWMECRKVYFDRTENREIVREAYRLKRSEPDGIEMNHAVVDEFTKPLPIKLTFYSGKLWHSDKPFPTGYQLPSFNQHTSLMKEWLSTAYEVVNPEVIPWTPGGFERCVDGDQITLLDGYGVYTFGMPKRVCNITIPENSAHVECDHICGSFDIAGNRICSKCGNTYFSLIKEVTIEKPENSAHGYTKLYEESGIITESQFIELNRVEPSESQEEPFSRSIQRDLRAFVPKMVSGELDEKLKLGYVQLINGKRVELILKIEVS